MKKSKRYIKKQNNKPLINKKVLAKVIREINLVQKLCDWDIISPLRFTDDEWCQISSDGTCQNRRKSNVFKNPDGSIHYNGTFTKRPIKYIEASYKYKTNTGKMTSSDYTHLFGYLNPYYRSAYNVSKRRK